MKYDSYYGEVHVDTCECGFCVEMPPEHLDRADDFEQDLLRQLLPPQSIDALISKSGLFPPKLVPTKKPKPAINQYSEVVYKPDTPAQLYAKAMGAKAVAKSVRSSSTNSGPVELDTSRKSTLIKKFETELRNKVIGQEEAVDAMVWAVQMYLSGLSMPNRPIANLLFTGPTGVGKTRVVEAAAEILFNSPQAITKINCGEYQLPHEIAKVIGAPPGYLGHRETKAMLTQESIDKYWTDDYGFSIVLFDEIEKASESFTMLLLGILDKATLTLGDNTNVSFKKCIITMTSNEGAFEMNKLLTGGTAGFIEPQADDYSLESTALKSIRKQFTPEFVNRLDKIVVFHPLSDEHLEQILDIELRALQNHVLSQNRLFILTFTPALREHLLHEGTDKRSGARELRRAIQRLIYGPMSNLLSTEQIEDGDTIIVDFTDKVRFFKE